MKLIMLSDWNYVNSKLRVCKRHDFTQNQKRANPAANSKDFIGNVNDSWQHTQILSPSHNWWHILVDIINLFGGKINQLYM